MGDGEEVTDPAGFAGSIPVEKGVSPRVRVGQRLEAGSVETYRLRVNGLVDRPTELTLADLRALPPAASLANEMLHPGGSLRSVCSQ